MSAHATAQLVKQEIPLLDYLLSQAWRPTRRIARGRLMGLCPLHDDRKPSFLVDPGKSLFYCYGCGRGGDVIRFAELLLRGELSTSADVVAAVVRLSAFAECSHRFLPHSVAAL